MKRLLFVASFGVSLLCTRVFSQDTSEAILRIPEAEASSEKEMKPYSEKIEHSQAKIDMIPIPGGTFKMGSPDSEPNRLADEGPVHE
ncbi:MAG: formylglycine-generating enzyme family protein, partial [Pirellula sp.]